MKKKNDNSNKNLLFISTRAFWKMDGGHQYEIFHYLRGLHEQYGYNIYVYTFVDDESADNKTGIPYFVRNVRFAKHISKFDILKNILRHSISFSDPWPLQNMLFFSSENARSIRAYAEKIKPQTIYVDMVRLAPYIVSFEHCNSKKILGYDDLLSERYKRQIELNSQNANIAGAYSEKLPTFLSKLQKSSFLKKLVLSFEAGRTAKSELLYAKKYDSGIFVSRIETKKFNNRVGYEFAYNVSMGIDFKYQSEDLCVEKILNSFSFVGNMKTAANYESVIYIIEKILPYLKTNYVFYIIGSCPQDLIDRYKDRDNIIFTGRVDDLRKAIKNTCVFLSPIAFGTGIKTKILEAFAMGMPVITNSVGIEGIEAENGVHCLISDNNKEIAHNLDSLLSSPELCSKLSINAQNLAKEKYQWEENWKSFANAGF